MIRRSLTVGAAMLLMLIVGCSQSEPPEAPVAGSFGADVSFLKEHVEVVILSDEAGGAQVAVVPAWQGRVMTSTSAGQQGPSFGWVNYDLIRSGQLQPHINVFGGEDRIWLGPEGGQFSIFFKGGDPFDLEHWQTPAVIDSEAFPLVSRSQREAVFQREAELVNYSGTPLKTRLDRAIRLLNPQQAASLLGLEIPESVSSVAFESENTITNTGDKAWDRESGMLSIWILGMYVPTPDTTVVIPFKTGSAEELGPEVKDDYFGKVPADRLRVSEGMIYFRADGESRGKIGVSPRRALPVLGSWDAGRSILTIVQYTLPEGITDYVNSAWEIQEEPFAGDTVNSYNDGPPEPGAKPMGPFFELETSSPAAALSPGESLTHFHRTFHFTGDRTALNRIAEEILGVSLDDIKIEG